APQGYKIPQPRDPKKQRKGGEKTSNWGEMSSLTDPQATGILPASVAVPKARQRRSSSSVNNATATMRVSLSDVVNMHGKERQSEAKARIQSAEAIRKQRRKSSLLQMGVASAVMKDVASEVLKENTVAVLEAAGDVSPVEKLQALLTKAKEKGMSAERLFEHFAPDGEASVTPAMFETALRKLGQRAFDLDEIELEHLVTTFDTDGNGTVELDEFMTFCLSIPSLPWRAEKARRHDMMLNNAESKDELNVAARRIARRRSSMRAIPIGILLYQGSRFFWRSKETIDVAYHYNSDEGLITISTRCPERAYNYPAIFVDVAKIPVHKSEAVERANSVGQFEAMNKEERQEATDIAMSSLRTEYLQHRLKVPDEVNGGPDGREKEGRERASPMETKKDTAFDSSDEEQDGRQHKSGRGEHATAKGGGAVVVPDGGLGSSMVVPWTTKPGEMTPQDRANDKSRHRRKSNPIHSRPFLARLSTDKWDSLLCARNIVLQTPHRFETAARRSSMADFRRASLQFEQLAKETEKLSSVAEHKSRKVEKSINNIAEAS
ncbi:unnamed protein product, partial [Pylaiella littoralis]